MQIIDFEQALYAQGYTTVIRLQERMSTASLGYQWYTEHLLDVAYEGVVVATYNEAMIEELFTPNYIAYELKRLAKVVRL